MRADSLPKSVEVLGLTYAVEICDLEDADGDCMPDRQRIRVREGMSDEKTTQVYVHELVHAVLAGLQCMDEYEDERLVQGLAIGLHRALGL
jgi:hypothetical protein